MKPGHVLNNGFDPGLFYPSTEASSGPLSIVFSGRLIPEKGAHVLVEAMRKLHEAAINARCTIIGAAGFGYCCDTEYVRNLRAALPPNTEMVGYLSGSEYAARLRQASVFCCPSIWDEPFGMVIVEAMASGLPVVASATGGIPEVLQHGGGLLAQPSNPDSLAAQLKKLILDTRLRTQMSEEAAKAANAHFTWTLIQQHYTQIANEVLQCGNTQEILSPVMLVS